MALPATIANMPKSDLWAKVKGIKSDLSDAIAESNSPLSPGNIADDGAIQLGGFAAGVAKALARRASKGEAPEFVTPLALSVAVTGVGVGAGSDWIAKVGQGAGAVASAEAGDALATRVLDWVFSEAKPASGATK